MLIADASAPVAASFVSTRVQAWLRALLPFVILLAWTCVIRLPFSGLADEDEFFYALVGARWLDGYVPYAASFDVKPPGIFAVFALAEAMFGSSLAMIKGLEVVFTALGAFSLFRLLDGRVSRHAALWAAGLYPVYSLTLSGVSAANMLIQLPFTIMAFHCALSALRNPSEEKGLLPAVFWSGVWIGLAGMIKQTAIFESVAIFVLLLVYLPPRRWLVMTVLFGLGAALPVVVFTLYFVAIGHFRDVFDAVILSAMARTSPDVLAGYGEKYRFYLTPLGATVNALALSVSLIFLWSAALLAAMRRKRLKSAVPDAVMTAAGLWLLAGLVEAVIGRALCTYYMLSFVPPLLILTSAVIVHGIDTPASRRKLVWPVMAVAAVTLPLALEQENLFTLKSHMTDYAGTQAVARELRTLGLRPQDHILVLNRGYNIYLETGAPPPTRYIHSTHTMTQFHTPSADALGENLAATPRFIVAANPDLRALDESPAKYRQAFSVIDRQYVLAGRVRGKRDSFLIYRYGGGERIDARALIQSDTVATRY